jgi:polyisoprenyl-phosphate glycosyltransferase
VDVSIVLPVYNERGHLLEEVDRIVKAMETSSYTYELIVVDDGSTDGSTAPLAGMAGVRLIRFETNRGSGAARRWGTQAARGRVVVWTDADMTYPNDEIPWLVGQLEGADQVVGARTSERGTLRALRIPAKWFIRRLACRLSGSRIPDLNSGFRAFRSDVARQFLHLLPSGFSCVSTITLAFLANGYSVRYVPISYAERRGRSKFHWWKDTRRYLTQVVRMVLTYNPLRIFLPLGAALLALGLAKLGYDWARRDFRLSANTVVVFLAAFQVISIGLLADLIGRVSRTGTVVPPATLGDVDLDLGREALAPASLGAGAGRPPHGAAPAGGGAGRSSHNAGR